MLDRDLTFDVVDAGLDALAGVVERRSGIVFAGARQQEFALRVRDYLAVRRFPAVSDLLRAVRSSAAEYDELLERLLLSPACFFHPGENFDAFRQRILPEMHMRKFWDKPRTLRVWSAGCGAGEEAYSIALVISEVLESSEAWNVHLLATDVSRLAIQHAQRGVYTREALATVSPAQLEACFARVGELYMARPGLRNLLTFTHQNLADPLYMGRFDCIFCVDVFPYLAADRRTQLVQRFYDFLEPGGYLFTGPDDELPHAPTRFDVVEHCGARIHQKPAGGYSRFAAGVLL